MGDKVLVRRLSFEGIQKTEDRFEPHMYVVLELPRPNIPVFRVRSEETNRERTIHRNDSRLVDHQNREIINEREGENEKEEKDTLDRSDVTVVEERSDSDSETHDYVQRTYQERTPIVLRPCRVTQKHICQPDTV